MVVYRYVRDESSSSKEIIIRKLYCIVFRRNNILSEKRQRCIYIDVIRILAISLVLFTHTGTRGNHIWTVSENIFIRNISLFADCFRCINTQLFMMISGALLLGKKEPWHVVYLKRIPRILVVLVVASIGYYFYWGYEGSIYDMLLMMYSSQTDMPLWYLYYYISLLLVLPFIRKMVQGMADDEFKLFMGLCFTFLTIIPALYSYVKIPYMNSQFSFWLNVTGIIYCMTGYYLSRKELSWHTIFLYGGVSFLFLLLGAKANFNMWKENGHNLVEAGYLFAIYPTSVFVFAVAKKIRFDLLPEKIQKVIKITGQSVFGIYILGDVLLVSFRPLYDSIVTHISPLIAVNIYLVVILAVGTIIVYLIRKIPLLDNLL